MKSTSAITAAVAVVLLATLGVVRAPDAAGYPTGDDGYPVHEYAAMTAMNLFFAPQADPELFQYAANVEAGSRHEDSHDHVYGQHSGAYPFTPTITHFWNADGGPADQFYESNLGYTFPNAWQKAHALWALAIGEYQAGRKANAYEYLGHVAHMLADMSVPAHAHEDAHNPGAPDWEPDTYEGWMKTNFQLSPAEQQQLRTEGPVAVDPSVVTPEGALYYLMYVVNQVGDVFPSDDAPGDKVNPTGWYQAELAAVPSTDLVPSIIRQYSYLHAIRATATLYQLFELAVAQSTLSVSVVRVAEDGVHDPGSDPDFYAKVVVDEGQPDAMWSSNRGDQITADIITPTQRWTFGAPVSPVDAEHSVLIEIWDADEWLTFGDDQSDITPGTGSSLDLAVDVTKCLAGQAGGFRGAGNDTGLTFPANPQAVCGVYTHLDIGNNLTASSRISFVISMTPPRTYQPLVPKRLLDSRDGTGGYATAWNAGETRTLTVTGGTSTVPPNATAVVLNMTAVARKDASHLTVWPFNSSMPLASNLNVGPGQSVANLVTVKVGAGGQISIFNNAGEVDVVADVVGYYGRDRSGSVLTGVVPERVLDSRDGTGGYATEWHAAETRYVTVTGGTTGVPVGAKAVALNVTGVFPTQGTHLTVWPADTTMPWTSSLNLPANDVRANLVIAKVSATGQVAIFNNSGDVDVVADVVGYFSGAAVDVIGDGSTLTAVQPKRLLDSRDGTPSPWTPGEVRTLTVAGGTTQVPGHAVSVVLNVTGVVPTAATHLTVWPTGAPQPFTSNLNLPANDVRPNLVIAKVGADGQISIANNSGKTHVVVDVVGYYTMLSGMNTPI
ncbi:MAG: hypothetical protein MUF83_01095 [Acidimicrobiales bacterium]|nr:hypothetical protein [Acidimicrobiales bacterium]